MPDQLKIIQRPFDALVVNNRSPWKTFLIRHCYDIGDQGVTVIAPAGLRVKRAAVYIQFKAEEWFDDETCVSNLGIAAALVSFYGCKHGARKKNGLSIDMYSDRHQLCGTNLTSDESLHREGLREFLIHHLQ